MFVSLLFCCYCVDQFFPTRVWSRDVKRNIVGWLVFRFAPVSLTSEFVSTPFSMTALVFVCLRLYTWGGIPSRGVKWQAWVS